MVSKADVDMLPTGTSANKLVKLDGSAKLPAVDGSQLTNLPAAGGGAWTLIQSQEASNSSSIDFTSGIDDTYSEYRILVSDVLTGTNGSSMKFLVSTDAGANFKVGGSDYRYSMTTTKASSATAVVKVDPSGTQIYLHNSSSENMGTATGERFSSEVRVINPSSSTGFTSVTYNTVLNASSNGTSTTVTGAGEYFAATTAVNAFRFIQDTGNIASGRFTLYGISHT